MNKATTTMTTEISDEEIMRLAERVGHVLEERSLHISTAESCTGGLLAGAITAVAGSSAWFETGYVTYANASKQTLVGVSTAALSEHGAVSEAVVREMSAGACERAGADVAVAVSGIAGPGGATADKPVGTVWLAWALRGEPPMTRCFLFDGDRASVRRQAVAEALRGTILALKNPSRDQP